MKTQKENEKKPLKNAAKIKVSTNGPYLVSGKIPLQKQVIIADAEGTATEWQPSTKYTSQENTRFVTTGTLRISRSATAVTILKQRP